jgi:GNAT superfamily N-acetyltransferase
MVCYAALLLKIGGLKAFFTQLRRQIYSKDILFGLEKDLDANIAQVSSRLPHSLRQASETEMEELITKAKAESKESVHELIERKWFYECGFCDCYAARTTDTGDLCFVAWLVSAKNGHLVNRGFKSRLPRLGEDELLLENCYTFEKYRGNGIMPSVLVELRELARSKGCKRLIAYVRQDNAASMRVFEKLAFRQFDKVPELKLFFFTRRKHNQKSLPEVMS